MARSQLVGLFSTVLDMRNCLVEREGQEGVDTMQEPVELSSKLVQERLDLEQQLEDMQATHQTKMEQMSSRVKQLGSCHSGSTT